MSCDHIAKPQNCPGHTDFIHNILMELAKRAKYLINNVKHKNLVRYLAFNVYVVDGQRFRIKIAQEFIDGESVRSICEKGQLVNVSAIAKEVLDSIIYLQNKPTEVLHGYLNDKSIFLDKAGVCRVADFDLISYMVYLKGVGSMHTESDVNALGNLIAQLRDIIMKSTNDFVDQCRGQNIQNSDLLKHRFLSNNWYCKPKNDNSDQSIDNFIIEKKLGEGSFGVVLQAKQELDKKSYAIKIVEMPEKKRQYEKAEREAVLISRINHKNIARYITSWKQENVNLTEFREQYGTCIDDDSMITDSVSE